MPGVLLALAIMIGGPILVYFCCRPNPEVHVVVPQVVPAEGGGVWVGLPQQ